MLGIGVLGPARAAYYLGTVAAGREDYYLGSGEAPGRWLGRHAVTLGLDGLVAAEDLQSLLAGLDPRTGERLNRPRENRTPGFDLTFSAPKSVSIVFALGNDDVAAHVREAHDAAVQAALGWLEENACAVRRGAGGARVLPGDGFIAAGFRHRTSRAGDPHLHTHVLVANITRGPEGKWSAPDGRHLFGLSKTAGHLYEAHLRNELTVRLGVEWQTATNGIADLVGIPRALVETLSQRRQAVLDRLDELGLSSARAAQIAVLDTRAHKDPNLDIDTCRIEWQAVAAEQGVDAAAISRLIGRVRPTQDPTATRRRVEARMLGSTGLTAHASTFDRRDVIQAWCNELHQGATVEEITELASQTLGSAEVLELSRSATVRMRRRDGRHMEAPSLGTRHTTADLYDLETRLLRDVRTREFERAGVVESFELNRTLLRHPHLSDEQQQMVRKLTQAGRGVEVVIAPAGAGKTTTLAAAREVWEASGYRVIGCAVAARAARQLESASGIPSHTVAALTRDLQFAGLPHRSVLIVDEAAMAGTRTLAPLLDAVQQAEAKIVLVGDPKQLPEIDAGGLVAALDHHLGGIHLESNRRQRAEWERTALSELREGDATPALDAYLEHGRINTSPTAREARVRLARDFSNAHHEGASAVMLATR